jgi:hypothetical protein
MLLKNVFIFLKINYYINIKYHLNINFNGNIAVRNDEDFEIIKSTVKEVIMESYKNLTM